MGLSDIWKFGLGGSPEQKVQRLQKKVVAKFGPPENRQGAIEELGSMKTEAAVEALLTRYTVRVDPGITDDDEKQRVTALVVSAGREAALPAVRRFIRERDGISWPLQALSELVPQAEYVGLLLEHVRETAAQYTRIPEKKLLLLHALGHHQHADAVAAALPFLDDMDDEVRIKAAQAVAAQRPADGAAHAGREPLIQAFLKAHQESNARVREALAGLIAEAGLDVKGFAPSVEAALPDGYKLDSKARLVKK